jgi:hypothetical protein
LNTSTAKEPEAEFRRTPLPARSTLEELQTGGERDSSPQGKAARAPVVFPPAGKQRGQSDADVLEHIVASAQPQPLWLPPGSAERYTRELGAEHFRRSELDWHNHGQPTATVTMAADRDSLLVNVAVRTAHPQFSVRRNAPYLDNENPDINSDGVQIHLVRPVHLAPQSSAAALLLVPEYADAAHESGPLRVSAQSEHWKDALLQSAWRLSPHGYELALRLARPRLGAAFAMDVIVNLLAPGRERRSGQLVMSGAHGEWIYLAGDRQPATSRMFYRIADV